MEINQQTHLLSGVQYIASPNADDRPKNNPPELIVIHNISLPPGEFGGEGISQLFTNRLDPEEHPYYREIHEQRVSAHLLIRRHGEIIQFVPFNKRAWHAGASSYEGRNCCNDFSIGIELEGTDHEDYAHSQYQTLAHIIHALCEHYPDLRPERVTGHEFISPGRKTDPGNSFDWHHLGNILGTEIRL